MKNSVYPQPCFSSQCGLCSVCTKGNYTAISKIHEEQHVIPEISYAEILAMFEKPRMSDMRESYMNTMERINIRDRQDEFQGGFEYCYGIIPNTYQVDETYSQLSVYRKQSSPHDIVCDRPICKAIYMSTPEYTQNTRFPHYPIYVRDIRDKVKNDASCNLCYVCLKKSGRPIKK